MTVTTIALLVWNSVLTIMLCLTLREQSRLRHKIGAGSDQAKKMLRWGLEQRKGAEKNIFAEAGKQALKELEGGRRG